VIEEHQVRKGAILSATTDPAHLRRLDCLCTKGDLEGIHMATGIFSGASLSVALLSN
jgi:hypothetical protein